MSQIGSKRHTPSVAVSMTTLKKYTLGSATTHSMKSAE